MMSIIGCRDRYRSTSCITFRRWNPWAPTAEIPSVVRCHRSWWSTSATDTLNFARMPAETVFTTWRFSLREPQPGIRRSNVDNAASMRPPFVGGGAMTSLQGPGDLADLERLDDVAFLDVLEVLQTDPALESLLDLTDVVLEPPKGRDPTLVDDRAVPDQAGPGSPRHRSTGDVAPRHPAQPGHVERGADVGPAQLDLLLGGSQQSRQGVLEVVDRLIDHPVQADVDSLPLGNLACLGVGTDVEPDHDGLRRLGQHDVALGDRPHALAEDPDPDLLGGQLLQRLAQRLQRSLGVGLQHHVELADLALPGRHEQVGQARGRLSRHELRGP